MFVISATMLAVGDLMLIPAVVGWYSRFHDAEPFLYSALIILVPAVIINLTSRRPDITILPRHAFVVTTLVWLIAAFAGALPIALHPGIGFTDAFFESMSGITTTGSTVFVGLDDTAPALLLWRSMLQWIGGLGFVMMAIAILPLVGVGGMRLYRSETSDWSEKSIPRTRDIAARIFMLYITLTLSCAVCYWYFGMTPFDALNHAMTTLATGGYSTSDLSMGKYAVPGVLWSSTLFMLLASLPFVMYIRALRGDPAALLGDDQVVFFLLLVTLSVGLCTGVLMLNEDYPLADALTQVAFNVVSTITTTGYASTDYTLWGPFFVAAFLFLMFTGGCSGSTAGSIKAFRIQIALKVLKLQIRRLIHPTGVFVAKLNHRRVDSELQNDLVAFIFAIVLTVFAITLGLAAMGLDLVAALSSAATAVANVGPGLGTVVGPAGNFSSLPDGAKWMLAGAMLLGRLELMTVLVLLTPHYWRT